MKLPEKPMEPTAASPEGGNVTGTIAHSLNQNASIQNIFGVPIETQGKTIIPVAQVALGLGGGYGEGRKKDTGEQGDGAGAGMGLYTIPKGIFEITAKRTRFIPVTSAKPYYIGAALAFMLAWLLSRKKR